MLIDLNRSRGRHTATSALHKGIYIVTLIRLIFASIVGSLVTTTSHGDILWFTDPPAWQDASGAHSQIDFTDFPHATVITNQYASVGVTFTNFVFIQEGSFWSDGFGLFGNDGIRFVLDAPHHAVAVDYVGALSFALYHNGTLVGTIGDFIPVLSPFVGIISEQPFDEVYLFKHQPPSDNNIVSIDNLYWGMPIPSPGVLPLLALAIATFRRRRRPA